MNIIYLLCFSICSLYFEYFFVVKTKMPSKMPLVFVFEYSCATFSLALSSCSVKNTLLMTTDEVILGYESLLIVIEMIFKSALLFLFRRI